MSPDRASLADLLTRLEYEALQLVEALFGAEMLGLLMIAALVFAGAWWARRAIVRGKRGTASMRAFLAAALYTTTVLLLISLFVRYVGSRAPLTTSLAAVMVVAGIALGIGIRARPFMVGAAAILGGRFRLGTQLTVGDREGVVDDIGLFGISVVTADGARVFVPTSRLSEESYAVASPTRVYPVELEMIRSEGYSDEEANRLRWAALICPFRQRSSQVSVELSADRTLATIRFRSWSEAGARLAKGYLRRA